MTTCLICCELFNNSTHKEVSCQWCEFKSCSSCCQTHILNQCETVCMNKARTDGGVYICQKLWTRKYVTDIFPKTWVNNEWKNMITKTELEREKALLPATIKVVDNRKKINILNNKIKQINSFVSIQIILEPSRCKRYFFKIIIKFY